MTMSAVGQGDQIVRSIVILYAIQMVDYPCGWEEHAMCSFPYE